MKDIQWSKVRLVAFVLAVIIFMAAWLSWAARRDEKLISEYGRYQDSATRVECLKRTGADERACWGEWVKEQNDGRVSENEFRDRVK